MTLPARPSSLPEAKEAEVQRFLRRLYDHSYKERYDLDEYVTALENALEERLRVNVGLLMEIDELKRERTHAS